MYAAMTRGGNTETAFMYRHFSRGSDHERATESGSGLCADDTR
jgi:hypothetical protein